MAGQGKIPASQIKEKFVRFLESFNAHDDQEAISQDADRALPSYVRMARDMDTSQGTTLYINFEHVNEYDPQLADAIITHHLEYDEALRQAVQTMVAKYAPEKLENGDRRPHEFFCSFYNLAGVEPMRKLKTHYIGRLVSFAGTVTRTSEVRPELFSGTFKCLNCGTLKRNVPQQFRYTEPLLCGDPTCGNAAAWQLAKDDSTFVDWQKACVQEAPSEVPSGCLPRTLDVILRNDMCEKVRPGDKVVFTGDVIVVPDVSVYNAPGEKVVAKKGRGGSSKAPPTVAGTADGGVAGVRGVGVRELNYRLAFLASSVQVVDKGQGMVNIRGDETANDVLAQLTEEQTEELASMANDPQIYSNLAKSIAPGVFGHEDVKRAILLMLFGGVHKTTRDGTKLRGDINVAIVGDPSCGKSQLLKYVASFLPRAVYTSGKSSSAAGLTATVARDNDTNEYCIEAGALMLADNGICCIDEFDKMDAKDQVAIHEAMEQQTISITKAGIQATLNARTSILAAANPIGGRYDKSKPLRANVNLTPAILSRFDLLHVMVDEPNDIHDYAIATHIVNVHRDGPSAFNVTYSIDQMQRYIKFARTFKPEITPEAAKLLVESYKHLRADDAAPGSNSSYRITVRQLEALIRLSQALARVRCSDRVNPAHVKEATRLLKHSIMAIEAPDVTLDEEGYEEELQGASEAVRQALSREPATGEPATAPTQAADVTGSNPTPEYAPPAAAEAPPKKGTQVSQKKYNMVKNLLVMKLREVEDAQSGQQEGEPLVLEGMKQHDLTKWFFEHQQQREMYSTEEEMLNEIVLVEKIIQRLIKKDHVLTVVEEPQREEGESAEAFLRRATAERVVALHPNYVQD